MHAIGIDHVNLGFPADRLDEVIDFYVETLGFETDFDDPYAAVSNDPGLFSIRLGDSHKLYVNPDDSFDAECANFRHVALQVPQSPAGLREFLDGNDLEIDHTAEREHAVFGSYTSYYVEDPFGYTVEFMAVGE